MMTRDAKIGLLVALTFILIVGILLSEHVTTTTTPGQAPLAVAGDRVRAGTHAPMTPAPTLVQATYDPNPQPRVAVATRDQLDAPIQMPPTARVELGRPADGQIQVIRVEMPVDPSRPADPLGDAIAVRPLAQPVMPVPSLAVQMHGASAGKVGTQLIEKTYPGVPQEMAEFARQHGAELVPVDAPREPAQPVAAQIPNGARVREYVAQPGDSLSRMASRLLGANTPANCQAIIALNPSLQKDSNRVIVGAKYLVPSDAWAAALRVNDEPVATRAEKIAAAKVDAKSSGTVSYTVKPGDSLWKIAEREVGFRGALAKIKQLNPDAFADTETVKVGMKLKLPAKAKP